MRLQHLTRKIKTMKILRDKYTIKIAVNQIKDLSN